jgi:putative membrane protein
MAQTYSLAALGLAGVLLAAGPAVAQDKAEQGFVTKAIQSNLAEVQMGKLAEQKGQDSRIRDFGKTLEQDHSANNQKAEALAQSLNITPPKAPDAEQKRMYERMSKLSGANFDREFASHMVTDHRKDIAEFSQEAKSSNAQVANYATQTLPDLKKHLQIAEGLAKNP